MNSIKSFIPKHRKKVLISKDFREILITQNTSIIEQRIIVMILSAIKDQQSELLSIKQSLKNRETQLSFDDYYEGWANQGLVEFIIPLNQLNPQNFMKNSAIQEALVNMTNINWMRLKDEKINGYKAVPFILEPSWNHKFIYFKMDKAVMKNLLNISQYYLFLKVNNKNLIYIFLWHITLKNFCELLPLFFSKIVF